MKHKSSTLINRLHGLLTGEATILDARSIHLLKKQETQSDGRDSLRLSERFRSRLSRIKPRFADTSNTRFAFVDRSHLRYGVCSSPEAIETFRPVPPRHQNCLP